MKRKEQYQDFHDFIIEGMMLCLEKYTINELPLTEVCKKAGVSRMTFYRHFKNKEEVVLEYFELIYDKFLKELLELESINSLILSEKLVGLFVEQEEEIEKAVKGNYYSLIFQVFAQRGLGNKEGFGCPADAFVFGDGQDIFGFFQVHDEPPIALMHKNYRLHVFDVYYITFYNKCTQKN